MSQTIEVAPSQLIRRGVVALLGIELTLDALSALLLVGGAAAFWVVRSFARHALRPVNDPRLPEALGAEGSHA